MNGDTREKRKTGSHPALVAHDPREVVEFINPVIADGFTLYEKTRTFYLNAARWPNRDHELLFDEQAEEIFASMDTLAGLVREMGVTPLRSISHSGEIQSVETYHVDSLSLSEMAEELIADNKRIAATIESARQILDEHDLPISILLMDVLDKTMNRIEQLRQAVIKYSAKQSRSR